MLNKLIIITILVLSSVVSFAAESVDATVLCVIEGHGGGCYSERIVLKEVQGAASIKATISEEDCYDDDSCDFCHSTITSEFETLNVNYLSINVEAGNNALIVTEGNNEVRVSFYDANGSYITTQLLNVNASVEMTY
jgi:hypothetical protein